jgi:hypothetical protein
MRDANCARAEAQRKKKAERKAMWKCVPEGLQGGSEDQAFSAFYDAGVFRIIWGRNQMIHTRDLHHPLHDCPFHTSSI